MIIYVEGIPASGKTTIVKRLQRSHPDLVDYIPEYINVKEGKKAENTHDLNFFIHNDETKWLAANKSSKKYVFVDRGHLSTILYYLSDFNEKKDVKSLQILEWYFNTILRYRYLPDYYIFLNTNPIDSLKRRENVLVSHNMWDHENALHFANTYYLKLIKSYETSVKLFVIKTDTLSLEEIEKHIISYFNLPTV